LEENDRKDQDVGSQANGASSCRAVSSTISMGFGGEYHTVDEHLCQVEENHDGQIVCKGDSVLFWSMKRKITIATLTCNEEVAWKKLIRDRRKMTTPRDTKERSRK